MHIEKVADKVKAELPGYHLVGFSQIAIPIYKRTLHCSVLSKQPLKVVEEFVLRYYANDIPIEKIALIMGIDYSLVEEAWWHLVQLEFINYYSKLLTELGWEYLQTCKLEITETKLIKATIDGLLGTVSKIGSQFMIAKRTKELGITSLRPIISSPEPEDLDLAQVRRVLREHEKREKDDQSNLLEVTFVEGKRTEYKRVNVFAFSNGESNRILVHDDVKSLDGYEDAMLDLMNKGTSIIKPQYGKYFDEETSKFLNYIGTDEKEKILYGEVWDKWSEILKQAKQEVLIIIPMIEICSPKDYWIETIANVLKKGINIKIVVAGRPFLDNFQKNQFEKLIALKNKFPNYRIQNLSHYQNKSIFVDGKFGFISSFERHSFCKNQEGLIEYSYELNEEEVKYLLATFKDSNSLKRTGAVVNGNWIRDKITTISQFAYELDDIIVGLNNAGWLGKNPIPNMQELMSLPIATNEQKFKLFITALNTSFVEIIDQVGKANHFKKYFWEDFKQKCPSVQNALERVRVYRNSANHLVLDPPVETKYLSFLDTDLDGSLPQFINKGFLILQEIVLDELETALRNTLQSYK